MGKQTKLTRFARGKDCTIRFYPHCSSNPEETVLAHAPSNDKGMGIKSPDWWGAHACYPCHMILDGQIKADDITQEEKFRAHMRGVFETQKRVIEKGISFE